MTVSRANIREILPAPGRSGGPRLGAAGGVSRRALLLGSLAGIGAAPAPAGVPVLSVAGHCVVTVLLDGRPAAMVLDTGASRTVVTRNAASRLGLRRDLWVDTTMRGAGGLLETHPNVDVRVATLGGHVLSQGLPGGLSLSVTTLDLGADGLLGADVLRRYTLDLDLPHAVLALRPPASRVAGLAAVKLTPWAGDLLLAPVWLDGRSLTALIDTGAAATLLNARGLYRLGLTPEQLGRDPAVPAAGLGGGFAARRHRFRQLRIGPLLVAEPNVFAAMVPEAAFDMTLGLDVLGQRRLVLSYAQSTLQFG